MITFKLRDYQTELIDQITSSLHAGNHSILVQSPPRSGKTVVMAEIARRATDKGNRVMFVVHRQEIVSQVKDTFEASGVNMELTNVGMIQTFTRRIERLPEPTIIFVDEAHHALAKSYTRLLEAFPNAYKLLFTGTPVRMNGDGFDEIADDLIVGKSIRWLTDHGNIAPFKYYAPELIDEGKLKRNSTGDYSNSSMDDAFKNVIYGDVIEHWQRLAGNLQTIAYTYSVESAKPLADEFNQAGIKAEAIDGSTPTNIRNERVQAFKTNQIQILVNVELFTEGFDIPNADAVIMLRPTQSLSLFLQFAMRPLNPREGKTAIMIDHVGNVQRFGLPDLDREWSLKGKEKSKRKREENELKTRDCQFCYGVFEPSQAIHTAEGLACPYCGELFQTSQQIQKEIDKEAQLVEIKNREEFEKERLANLRLDARRTLIWNYDVASAKGNKPLYKLFGYLTLKTHKVYSNDQLEELAEQRDLSISSVRQAHGWAHKKLIDQQNSQPQWMKNNFY